MDDPDRERLPDATYRLLIDLATWVQRFGFYPDGHPALESGVDELSDALRPVLDRTGTLVIEVARDHLVVDGAATDPDEPKVRQLAERLHEHRVAGLQLTPGIEDRELEGLLGILGRSPEGREETLESVGASGWPHVEVVPVDYESLALGEEARGEALDRPEGTEGDDLWAGLARAALARRSRGDPEDEVEWTEREVSEVATALEGFAGEAGEARGARERMVDVVEELAEGGVEGAPRLRRRLGELFDRLGEETIRSLVREMPEPRARRFAERSARELPVETSVRVAEAVLGRDDTEARLVLRLLGRAAAGEGRGAPVAPAGELRGRLVDLIRRRASEHGVEAGGSAETAPDHGDGTAGEVRTEGRTGRPLRVLRAALEASTLGPAGRSAIRELQVQGRVGEVLRARERAERAGREGGELVWNALDVEQSVIGLLEGEQPDYENLDLLIDRVGRSAIPALIHVLAESESRDTRRAVFGRLESFGSDLVPAVVRRLEEDDRWYVERNMLALLAKISGVSADEVPADGYLDSEEPPVRREAYKFLLGRERVDPAHVRRALRDESRQVRALGLGAAGEHPDEENVSVLEEIAEDPEEADGLRAMAARALGSVESDGARKALIGLCRDRPWWMIGSRRLARKSPTVLAALEQLARRWNEHPDAQRVLDLARDAADPELRSAATGGSS